MVVLVQVETLRTVTDAVEGGCGSEYVGKRTGRVRAAEEPEVDVVIQGDAAGLHPDAGAEGVVAAVVALAVKDGDDAGKVETDVSSEREAIKEEQEKQSVWCVQACILVCANVMKCELRVRVYLGKIEVRASQADPGFWEAESFSTLWFG